MIFESSVVLNCLLSLGRVIQRTVPEFRGPYLGPRESTPNPREFDAEQRQKGRLDSSMPLTSMGSAGIMERTHVSRSNDVAFGAQMSGQTRDSSVPILNSGSAGIMERSHVSRANDITFGHDMTK